MSDVAEEEALLDITQEDGLPDAGEVIVGSRVHNDSRVATEGGSGQRVWQCDGSGVRRRDDNMVVAEGSSGGRVQ